MDAEQTTQNIGRHCAALIDRRSGRVLLSSLRIAASFLSRFRGLQFQKPLSDEEGLLIVPCRSIHTHWMRFSIDVAWIDATGRILEVKKSVRPWSIAQGPKNAEAVIETTAGGNVVETGQFVMISLPSSPGPQKLNRSLCKLSDCLTTH